MVTQIHEIQSDIWGNSPPPQIGKLWRSNNIRNFFAEFPTTSRLDRWYLRKATKRRCKLRSLPHLCILNFVNFGLQMAKNVSGVSTQATGGHHAGHCHVFPVDLIVGVGDGSNSGKYFFGQLLCRIRAFFEQISCKLRIFKFFKGGRNIIKIQVFW